jgi:hypothetical protein
LDPQRLSEVTCLIYDPVRGNMLMTRSVLHGIGFRKIEGLTSIRELKRRLGDNDLSILFIEATESSREIIELVRSIRLGELGFNPFLPIVATIWTGQTDLIADLMNSGTDDVLLRPFSAHQALERVKFIINSRKPFVVTSDYVGPDRGRPSASGMPTETFEPPNALRDRVMTNNCDPIAQNEALIAACRRVDQDRLAKLARRIAMAAEVTIHAQGKSSASAGFVVDLLDSAAELVRAAKRLDIDEVQDITAVLENVVARTAAPGPERVENAQLTRQLALALFVAYSAETGSEFKLELDETLNMVRSRLDKAKERARRRQSLALSMAS